MIFESSSKAVAFLYVTDRSRALAFYGDLLGLEHESADAFGDFLSAGDTLVRMTVMPDHQPGPHPVFGWDVADIAAAAQALRRKDVSLIVYDGMGQDELGIWTAPDGKAKVAWFSDSEGNLLSLSQS